MLHSETDRRRAFSTWLRTGRLPAPRSADGVELKFNPYHDPRDGRFTFAPGGSRLGSASDVRYARSSPPPSNLFKQGDSRRWNSATGIARPSSDAPVIDGPNEARLTPAPQGLMPGRGGNIRAFEDPMTLEEMIPELRGAPGGVLIGIADNLLDLREPAQAMIMDVLRNHIRQVTYQIRTLDPQWHYDEIVPSDSHGHQIESISGLSAKLNDLRFSRAVLISRNTGDYRPLQVETYRFMQRHADRAYQDGLELLKAGRLNARLSDQEALGNYVDARVRIALRAHFNRFQIDSAGPGPVRVNRREANTSGGERTYRRPDARVAKIAFDVTLAEKTEKTAQVRGFFDGDFRPTHVVIVRPRQVATNYAYIITRPASK